MKENILKTVVLSCVFFFCACQKETTIPFAQIVGDWSGKETYNSYLGDSTVATIIGNFDVTFSQNGTGFITSGGSKYSLVWSYNAAQNEIDVRFKINVPPNVSFTTYPFSIEEDKPTSQKWSTYSSYLSTGKVRKFITRWDLTKK
jgi:hypothetical protein